MEKYDNKDLTNIKTAFTFECYCIDYNRLYDSNKTSNQFHVQSGTAACI